MKKILLMLLVCLMAFTSFSVVTVNAQTEKDSQEEIVEPTTSECVLKQSEDSTRSSSVDVEFFSLEVVDGVPRLPSVEDPSIFDYTGHEDMLNYVKRGDLIYEPLAGFIYVGYVGHSSIVLDIAEDPVTGQSYILLLDIFPDGGVCYGVLYPERFVSLHGEIKRLTNVSESVIESAISWMMTQYGKPYDFEFNKSFDASSPNWYCSELIWAGFYNQGVNLDSYNNVDTNDPVAPWDINGYEGLTSIVKYNTTTNITIIDNENHQIICDGDVYVELHDYEMTNSCYEKCSYCNYSRQANSHVYGHHFTRLNNPDYHYSCCQCGASKTESHTFVTVNSINTCVDCGYSIAVNHEHSYFYKPLSDGVNHSKKCSCGYSVTQPCIFQSPEGGGTSMCVFCKRLKPSGGGIIGGGIMGSEDEETLNSLRYVPTVQLNENSFQGLLD